MTNQYYRLAIVAGAAVVAFILLAVRKRRQGKSRMDDEAQYRKVFIDFLPNQSQTDQGRENSEEFFTKALRGALRIASHECGSCLSWPSSLRVRLFLAFMESNGS
jgi:hypothetical protein